MNRAESLRAEGRTLAELQTPERESRLSGVRLTVRDSSGTRQGQAIRQGKGSVKGLLLLRNRDSLQLL